MSAAEPAAGPAGDAVPQEPGVTVLCEERCHLGEGPAYDPVRDSVWWFDILERRLYEASLASGAVARHELPFMASVLAPIDETRQLIAADNGLYVRNLSDGRLSLHVALEADNAATRSNDGRVHPSGALWIGTMGRRAEPGAGAIYHVLGAEVSRLYSGITIPNAICFSPDGRTAYFADTAAAVLLRVAVDPANGRPVGAPSPLHDHRGEAGGLDGAVVDAEGLIWNARWGAGCVDAYAPDGRRVRSLRVPAAQPSCPVFIGRDFARLAVTSALEHMDEAARRADPHGGKLFVLRPGAVGRPEPRFRLSAS